MVYSKLPRCFKKAACKAPEKLCSSAPRAKDALNERDVTPNADLIYLTENLFMTLFLTASSFYSIFTQVLITFHSPVSLQEVS